MYHFYKANYKNILHFLVVVDYLSIKVLDTLRFKILCASILEYEALCFHKRSRVPWYVWNVPQKCFFMAKWSTGLSRWNILQLQVNETRTKIPAVAHLVDRFVSSSRHQMVRLVARHRQLKLPRQQVNMGCKASELTHQIMYLLL